MQRTLLLLIWLAALAMASVSFQACNNATDRDENGKTAVKDNPLSDAPVDQVLAAYYDLSEAFVNWDSTSAHTKAATLKERLEKVISDTAISAQGKEALGALEKEAAAIAQQKDITQQRRAFHTFSQHFYSWLNQNKYKGSSVYFQECPMAFKDEETGQWLSRYEAIRNPFLGLHHPKYKRGMLECGTVKDSIKRSAE